MDNNLRQKSLMAISDAFEQLFAMRESCSDCCDEMVEGWVMRSCHDSYLWYNTITLDEYNAIKNLIKRIVASLKQCHQYNWALIEAENKHLEMIRKQNRENNIVIGD